MNCLHKRILKFFLLLFIFVFFTVTAIYFIFERSLSYQLEQYATSYCANKINAEINSVVLREISESGLTYDSIINISKDNEGKIISVGADMIEVSALKSRLEVAISEICDELGYNYLKIPIGNLVGKGVFYGKGFDITMKFRPVGYSDAKMRGELTSVGINQSIYRISFDAIARVGVVFPFRYIEMPVEVENVIAETVIIGTVPNSFTHFDLEGDITSQDFQGYVEDYMAE